jgi:hypothetical protein
MERHIDVLVGLAYPTSVLEDAAERALGRNILFGGLLAEYVPGGCGGCGECGGSGPVRAPGGLLVSLGFYANLGTILRCQEALL